MIQKKYCILGALLDAYPHLSRTVVVAGSAEIDESHILLRTDYIRKVKRDVMADSYVLFLLDPDAADNCNEEHCIISLKFRIAILQRHEIWDYVFFQLRMSVSARSSADAEDLFYFGIVKAGENYALADISSLFLAISPIVIRRLISETGTKTGEEVWQII